MNDDFSEPKQFRGEISIGHASDHLIHITIEDSGQDSGTRLLDLRITPEAWGNAVSGLGAQPFNGILYNCDCVGHKRMTKREMIPLPSKGCKWFSESKPDEIRAVLSPFEVDGWIGTDSDVVNAHNIRAGHVSVLFYRYVPPGTQGDES